MTEETSPYTTPGSVPHTESFPAGRPPALKRVRIPHLQDLTDRGERWAMLTSYDMFTAQIFDAAGIPALLVGDSAGNNVYGYSSTLPVTVDELIPLVRAVSTNAPHSLVIADLPFGSYEASPEQALATATRFMKEGLAQAVKLEGGMVRCETVQALTRAGIPVMAHIGFTPQSEHALGGYRVQGRGAKGDQLVADARALEAAGAFAIVLEMVPTLVAGKISHALRIPTVGIGAGPQCDAQVLVWQDFAGLRGGRMPRFVQQYANLRQTLTDAARAYAEDVRTGGFPSRAHGFEDEPPAPPQ